MADHAAEPQNWFDTGAEAYLRFRPDYPEALAGLLGAVAPGHDMAVDVGCGNGQLTVHLAGHFRQVTGFDPSAEQIASAQQRPPQIAIHRTWTLEEFLGYVSTWSAVRRLREAGRQDVLAEFAADIAALWGPPDSALSFSWPINMRLGTL